MRAYRGATVVDGTGAPRYVADVVTEGARVVAIDTDVDAPHAVEIDARGLVLAPGFIDMHAHSDLAVLRGAEHDAKLLQGVTTEVVGQDGLGYAPVDDAVGQRIADQIAGWNGPVDAAALPWRDVAGYLAAVDPVTAGNVAVLVPQGNLRMMVVGHEPRAATTAEIARMCALLGEALDAGAAGMSSGLTYTPGMYASTAELEALCRVVAERGGFWSPHTRGYGGGALAAFAEAIAIGRATGCPVHLTHATMNFAVNRSRAPELLAMIDAARAEGVAVTLDTYPYLPGATTLAALLPSELSGDGDLLGALRTLDVDRRARLHRLLDEVGSDGFHGEIAEWDRIEISGSSDPRLVGRTIADLAAERGRAPVDVVVDVLLADGLATTVLMHVGDEDNVRTIMRHPAHAGSTDGILVGGKPHPRGFGGFAHYLGHYVRELGVLGLEEAVRHLSHTPARILGLHRGDAPRGVIAVGATADLVLFDPATIAAGATFDAPRTPPLGVKEVLVAGVVVARDGVMTGHTPGKALRRPPAAHRAVFPHPEVTVDAEAPACVVRAVSTRIDAALAEEEYVVTVAPTGATVVGGSAAGVFRGGEVLRQLRDPDDPDALVPSGIWRSRPAHSWRGLMLDVARHFRPVEDVLRLIDLMAAHALNVLHLHLTDDQGWRFVVPGYPRLVEVGARRAGTQLGHGPLATVDDEPHAGWYTADDLRRIVAYAADRHVVVVPEVDLPGHVQAAIAAYPELAIDDAGEIPTEPWARFGLNPHTLNLEERTLDFCRAALDALCDVFPSEIIGIGGDEVPTAQWAASARVAERRGELGLASVDDVQPWFTARLAEHLATRGRRAYAWDDVLRGAVPADVVIGAWRGEAAARIAGERGFDVVACPDMQAYLDYRQSEEPDEPVPVGPPLTLADAWAFRVPSGALGGQANVWSEHLRTRDALDFALFPRLALIADRLWQGGEPGRFDDALARLETHMRRLAAWGVSYRPSGGPAPRQRRPGVPGAPRTRAQREAVVADLVAELAATITNP